MDIKELSYEDSIVRMAKLVEHICELRNRKPYPCIGCVLAYGACRAIKEQCEKIENKELTNS